MNRIGLASLVVMLSIVCPLQADAAVLVKLGTLAPEGSTWDKALRDIADKWKEASGGEVKLRIYAGGMAGDETDMVRKMRVGQLSGAAISAVGLHDIAPEPQALATPMMIRSYDELDYVMSKMGGELEKSLADKGFVVLTWSDAGFIYFFSKKPAAAPAEMASQPLFAWAGDPKAVEAWKAAGFHPVVISSTDMIPSLQTGMIQAFTTTPLIALSLGWYSSAPNMTDVTWGILPGAVVISKEQWDKVPADLQPKLLASAHQVGDQLRVNLRKQGDEAIASMRTHGLTVVPITGAQRPLWIKAAEASYPVIRGGSVPAATFDEVKKYVEEYRAHQK